MRLPERGARDLIDCDAIFDPPGGAPGWSFRNYVIAHNPAHRWYYYSNMTPRRGDRVQDQRERSGRAPS